MDKLAVEIGAFQQMQQKLQADHMGRWVLIHERSLVNVYDSFEGAAEDAVRQFGRGPYLIRQVGAAPLTLPVSVAFFPQRDASS